LNSFVTQSGRAATKGKNEPQEAQRGKAATKKIGISRAKHVPSMSKERKGAKENLKFGKLGDLAGVNPYA